MLVVLMLFFPSMQKRSPRFWNSEKKLRRTFFTLAIAFGFISVVTLGIVKEWFDSYGWGDVEFLDLVADVAGVVIGIALVLKSMRREKRRHVRVSLHSRTHKKVDRPVNFFRPVSSLPHKRESRSVSESDKENL